MPFSRFPGTGAKTTLNTSAVLQLGSADIAPDSLTAADLAPDAVAASELASGAVTAAGTEIAAGAVVAGNVAVGGVSAANQFAAGVVDATAIGPDAVGTSEIASGILPWSSGQIPCTNPAVAEALGAAVASKDVTLTNVLVRCGTLPTGATDAFSFNIHNGTVGNIFSSNQVWAREKDVSSFKKTLDIDGPNPDGTTWTTYTTEVTGAGTAALGGLDTLANGDALFAGSDEPYGGLRVDMDGVNVNAQAAVLAGHYWNGTAWTALTVTDGTAAAGATFAQDGIISFDAPVDWRQKSINGVTSYWTRWTHNGAAALTAGTAIDNLDVIRDVNVPYGYVPNQNLTVSAGAALEIDCTEVDANAAGLTVEIVGTVTT